jgi:hypothetical protein
MGQGDSPGGAPPRAAHGFRRTTCGCAACAAFCRHLPGALDPSDLVRLCPPGQDLLAWAEQHLRAQVGRPVPSLVPARDVTGHCHWFFDGRCAVHADAPYGCAFFDSHLPHEEVDRRAAATARAIRQDLAEKGPYYQVWRHLRRRGLTVGRGDRGAVIRELQSLGRRGHSASGDSPSFG